MPVVLRLFADSIAASATMTSFTGTVHSVYARACNVASKEHVRPAVVTPESGNVPHGLVVTPPPGFAFTQYARPGMPVSLRQGVLRIGRHLSIELRGATIWNDDVRGIQVDLAVPAQSNAWREAWKTLSGGETLGYERLLLGLDDIHLVSNCPLAAVQWRGSVPPLSVLPTARRGVASLDLWRFREQCAILVGAGPGLTPAGDDFLVGYLAGLWSTAGTNPRRLAAVESLAKAVRQHVDRTIPISQMYLLSAAEGRIAQKLHDLIAKIALGVGTRRATAAAMATGSTSGRAGVLGLLLGLTA